MVLARVPRIRMPVLLVAGLLAPVIEPSVASAAPSTWTGGGGSGLWGTSSPQASPRSGLGIMTSTM